MPVAALVAMQQQRYARTLAGGSRQLDRPRVRPDLAHVQRVPAQHRRVAAAPRGAGRRRRPRLHRAACGWGDGTRSHPSSSAGCRQRARSRWSASRRVLASRPLWQTVRQSAADPGARVVAGLQLRQGLPVDGGRTYAEQSLVWMSWWLGPAALVLALVAAAALTRRALAAWTEGRELPVWTGAFVVALGSTLLTWYRPGITPDHPWADRRLVIALPTVILLVVAVAAVLTRWSTHRMPAPVLVVTSVVASLALLVPTALATWPHAQERVELGESAAVERVCEAFRPGEVALMVDSRAANEWPQVLRGQCGVPALSTTTALRRDDASLRAAVQQVRTALEAQGLLPGAGCRGLDQAVRELGSADVTRAVDVTVREDAQAARAAPRPPRGPPRAGLARPPGLTAALAGCRTSRDGRPPPRRSEAGEGVGGVPAHRGVRGPVGGHDDATASRLRGRRRRRRGGRPSRRPRAPSASRARGPTGCCGRRGCSRSRPR